MSEGKEVPRLSPSIAKLLLDKSPLHAWNAHRLMGGNAEKATASKLLGSAADVATLGVETKPDGKKKRPAPKRDAKAKAISEAVKSALSMRNIVGISQHRLEWTVNGVDCSGYIDLTDLSTARFWDLKTAADLSDENITRQIEKYHYNMQIAAYAEGLMLAGYAGAVGTLIFVESDTPHDVRFVPLSDRLFSAGLADWHRAQKKWRHCLLNNKWPGRGDFVADVSGWRLSREPGFTDLDEQNL